MAAHDDGQWRGEGLLESQDYGQYNGHGVYASAWAPSVLGVQGAWAPSANLALGGAAWAPATWGAHGAAWAPAAVWGHGAAPLGPDGRVVDTPEVAHAKAAHLAAKAAASHGAVAGWAPSTYAAGWAGWAGHGAAPIGIDGRVVDTPEVAHAKAAHFAAKAAASHGAHW